MLICDWIVQCWDRFCCWSSNAFSEGFCQIWLWPLLLLMCAHSVHAFLSLPPACCFCSAVRLHFTVSARSLILSWVTLWCASWTMDYAPLSIWGRVAWKSSCRTSLLLSSVLYKCCIELAAGWKEPHEPELSTPFYCWVQMISEFGSLIRQLPWCLWSQFYRYHHFYIRTRSCAKGRSKKYVTKVDAIQTMSSPLGAVHSHLWPLHLFWWTN